MSSTQERVTADPAALAERLRALGADSPGARVLVGIVGAPGGGKSTLAQALVAAIGASAVEVPMDGFHLAQSVLDAAGTAAVKGAPHTFDAAGYVALMRRIRGQHSDEIVYAPTFRREIEEPIAGAIPIRPEHRYIITEGNYLLLDTAPWTELKSICHQIWFLDTPEDIRLQRLVSRHIHFGWSAPDALVRATTGSDGVNGRTVLASRHRADLLITD